MFDMLQQNVLHMPIEHGSRNRFISIFDLTEGKTDSLQLIASSPTARSVGIFLPEEFIPLSAPLQTGFFDMILLLFSFFPSKISAKKQFLCTLVLGCPRPIHSTQKCFYLGSLNIWNLVWLCGWTFTDGEFLAVQVSAHSEPGPGNRGIRACASGTVWKLPAGQIQGPTPCWGEWQAPMSCTSGIFLN